MCTNVEAIVVCCDRSLSQPELWGGYGFMCFLKSAPPGRSRDFQIKKTNQKNNQNQPCISLEYKLEFLAFLHKEKSKLQG